MPPCAVAGGAKKDARRSTQSHGMPVPQAKAVPRRKRVEQASLRYGAGTGATPRAPLESQKVEERYATR